MRSRFGPHRRLRSAREFDVVFKRGRRLPGRLFLLVVAENRRSSFRLGLAVSRRVGGAVARSRARRLLRESFRRLPREGGAGIDVVVVPNKDIVSCSQAEVDRELGARLARVRRASEPPGARPDPAR
jgi:ribonuclease P protein component